MKHQPIIDYAPKRQRRQRSFSDLIPGIFIFSLVLLVPASPPQESLAAEDLGPIFVSPVPLNTSFLTPTLPMTTPSPVERSDSQSSTPSPSVEPRTVTQIIEEVFGSDARTAIAIAKAESRLRCGIVNAEGAQGLFQIMPVHNWRFQGQSRLDCYANALVAYQIFKSSGWYPWTTYNNGAYKKYL